MKVMMVVRAVIPDIDASMPSARDGGEFPALAVTLALLLSVALAACGEAGDDSAEEAAPGAGEQTAGAENAAPPEDLPLVEMDADGALIPQVIMPEAPDEPDARLPVTLLPVTVLDVELTPADAAREEAPDAAAADDILAAMPSMLAISPGPLIPPLSTITRVRALDKITARVIELDLPQDTEVRFGTLAIRARTCRSRPPEEPPETFAFLEIDDVKTNQEYERIFAGWMMASSPALNALEHPVYDVWVIACRSSSPEASSASE